MRIFIKALILFSNRKLIEKIQIHLQKTNICEKFLQIKLFRYQKEDYFNSKSKNLVSESRLKKLDNIKLPELKQIKELLKKEKSSAYQEKNIQNIENYIKKII